MARTRGKRPGPPRSLGGAPPTSARSGAAAVRQKLDALLAAKGGSLPPSLRSFSGVKEVRALWDAPRAEQARAAEVLIAQLFGSGGADLAGGALPEDEARRRRDLLERMLD